jgi:hypothetical protein
MGGVGAENHAPVTPLILGFCPARVFFSSGTPRANPTHPTHRGRAGGACFASKECGLVLSTSERLFPLFHLPAGRCPPPLEQIGTPPPPSHTPSPIPFLITCRSFAIVCRPTELSRVHLRPLLHARCSVICQGHAGSYGDSDDKMMFIALMEEEAAVASVDDEEHLMMLLCLMALYAHDSAKPRRGGSAPGRRKSKSRQRMEGYCILYDDYFVDNPLHGEVVFRACTGCALGSIHYCLVPCSYLVQRSDIEGHECMCNHAQHNHRE